MEPTLPPGLPIVPEPTPASPPTPPVPAPMSAAPEVPTAPSISAMATPPEPPAPLAPAPAAPEPPAPSRGFRAILGDAFGIWKRQWLRLIGVALLGIVPIGLAAVLILMGVFAGRALGMAGLIVAIALGVIGVFLAIVGLTRLGVTYLHLIAGGAEGLGIRDAWNRSKGATWSFIWVSLLAHLVTAGGALMFIAPAIVWSVSFAVLPWVFAVESGRGLDALATARARVKGNWWRLVLNFVVFGLLMAAATGLLAIAAAPLKGNGAAQTAIAVLNGLLQFVLLSPLSAAFSYSVYSDLRIRNAEPLVVAPKQKTLFAVAAVLGLLAQIAMLALMAYAPMKFLGSAMRFSGGGGLSNDLEMPDPDAGLLLPVDGTEPEAVVEEPVVEEPAGAPEESDDDQDGYPAYIEANEGTDPNNPDTDGDGLADGDELTFGSSPTSPDTDGDGFADGEEVKNGYHPGVVGERYDEERLSVIRGAAGNFHEPTRTTLEGAPVLGTP